jgi:uncharacterized protein involved in exopolysaccharide biosynthesis
VYRYVDAVFSHKLVVLVPIILIPLFSSLGSLFATASYEVSARIWVEQTPLFDLAADKGRSFTQSNQLEANTLGEWLSTNAFVDELIERAELRDDIVQGRWPDPSPVQKFLLNLPLVGGLLGDSVLKQVDDADVLVEQAITRIRTEVSSGWVGAHLVKLTYKGDRPDIGVRLVSAATELYGERSTGARIAEAQAALQFFERQIRERQREMESSAEEMDAFRLAMVTSPNGEKLPSDLAKMEDLQKRFTFNRTLYEASMSRLEQARLEADAVLQTRQSGFAVVDYPKAPVITNSSLKKAGGFALIGLLVGVVLGIGAAVVMSLTDSTIRSREQLAAATTVPVLGTVPRLVEPNRPWRGRLKSRPLTDYLGRAISDDLGPHSA